MKKIILSFILSFILAPSIMAAPITQNYLIKADPNSGTNRTAQSVIIDNGNVGISTANPSAKLDVNGTIKSSGGTSGLAFSGGGAVQGDQSAIISFTQANIGIGTTVPSTSLQITSTTDPNRIMLDAIGSVVDSVMGQRAGGSVGALTALANGDDLMRYMHSARGTSTYDSGTDILVETDGAVTNTSAPTAMRFYTTASGSTTDSERMTILNGGNVGISSANPGNTLDVIGTARVSGNVTVSNINGSTQCVHADTNGVLSGTGSDCGSGGSTGANPTASVGLTAVNGSASTFLRSDGAPALSQSIVPTWTGLHTFTGGFNVTTVNAGIGTASPTASLQIVGASDQIQLKVTGNSTQTNNLISVTKSDGTSEFGLTNAGVATFGGAVTSGGTNTQSSNGYGLVVNSTQASTANGGDFNVKAVGVANALFVPADSGNVGIGTASPTQKLEVKGGLRVINATSNWTKKTGANTACDTTCGTSMCAFGEDTGVIGTLLSCSDATADVCICMGS